MTSSGASFYESLGRASTAPPDISKTNYLETEVDMTKSVNENIDETQKGWDEHYNSLITMWNDLHKKQADRPEALLNMLKQGKEDVITINDYRKALDKYYKYARPLKEEIQKIRELYPPGSPEYVQAMRLLGKDIDKDVMNEIALTNDRDIIKGDTQALLITENRKGNVTEANDLNSTYQDDVIKYEDMDMLLKALPAYWEAANVGMEFHGFREDPDGNSIPITYNDGNLEEKREIRMSQNAWFAIAHEDVVEGRLGLYKREFVNKLIEQEELDHIANLKDFQTAQVELIKQQNARELGARIENNPSYITTHIQINMKNPDNWDDRGNVQAKVSRDITEKDLMDIIANGTTAQFNAIIQWLETDFEAHDGSMQKPDKYWPEMSRRLRTAINNRLIEDEQFEADQRKTNEIAFIKEEVAKIEESEEVVPWKDLNAIESDFRQKFDYAANDALPAHANRLLTLQYKGQEEDHIIAATLRYWHRSGVGIEHADLVGIQDENLKKNLLSEFVGTNAGLKRNSSGPGSTDLRNSAVTAIVNDYRDISTTTSTRDNAWYSNYEQAILFYNEKYAEQFAVTGNATASHRFAVQETKVKISEEKPITVKLPNGKTETRVIGTWDIRPHWSGGINYTERHKTIQAVNKDRSLLNQSTPWEGEEKHLETAATFIEKIEKGTVATYPEYYRFLGERLKINPLLLMRQRLIATGLMDKDSFQIAEEGKPGERLLSTSTSSSRTIRAYLQNGDDVSWMLKTSQNPNTLKEGGYTAIRNPDGKYENIEEVTQLKSEDITLGDIATLVAQGYNNIGMYDLQAFGLLSLLESSGLPLDMPWNEQTQDALYLARLRQKAQQAQNNSGVDVYYRRLTNINRDLHERFKEVAGDLPPMLDPTNLQPDVAKELIKMLTEE